MWSYGLVQSPTKINKAKNYILSNEIPLLAHAVELTGMYSVFAKRALRQNIFDFVHKSSCARLLS